MKWHSVEYNTDTDTGEQITKPEREKNYIILKQKRNVTIKRDLNGNEYGIIEYTNECKRSQQLKLF